MCGDGVNDAPALRQAQIGIAVSTATDVAKSAAGMVLTEPGLAGIVAAVKEGRMTFQRIQNYTINSITKKIVTVLFLMAGLIMTGQAILTPLLMVIVMIAGDFLAMSLTTDNVRATPAPNAWRIDRLTIAGCDPRGKPVGVLLRGARGRHIRIAPGDAIIADSVLRNVGVRQSGDDLRRPGSPVSVERPPELVAGRVVALGRDDGLFPGYRRYCHGAAVGRGGDGDARRRLRICAGVGSDETDGVRAPRNCLIHTGLLETLANAMQ